MIKSVVLVLILSYISTSDACSCGPFVKKDAYCKSNFVGMINVTSVAYGCGQLRTCYQISVVKKIRGIAVTPSSYIYLQTPSTSATCGTSLTKEHTYLVATNQINSSTLGLTICNFKDDWTGLSKCKTLEQIKEWRSISCKAAVDVVAAADQPVSQP